MGRAAERALLDRAAGGVVVHGGSVLVVHRPRYDDWSLPKGHLDPGETWEQAALREVHEETGVRCRVGSPGFSSDAPAGSPFPVSYLTLSRKKRHGEAGLVIPKIVLFFAMVPEALPEHLAGDPDEVDEAAWWPIDEALRHLSYPTDREALAALTTSLHS